MTEAPSAEMIDRSLLTELRDSIAIGSLTLHVADATTELGVRHNVKRVHLERAIVALPATERLIFCMHDGEGYSHNRIARTLGITEQQSTLGLHQARLRVRELVAEMR
jgi:RNA polymerase sigma-70 factor (ECF subfamily)